MKTNYLYALLLLAFLSCKQNKVTTTGDTPKTTPKEQGVTSDPLYRFTVSFISIGTGIDAKAKQAFLDFVQAFNTKNNVDVQVEKTSWGREGETDYCLKLTELKEDAQARFIAETKEVLKNSTRVRYKVIDRLHKARAPRSSSGRSCFMLFHHHHFTHKLDPIPWS
jgi:hypothetical protein